MSFEWNLILVLKIFVTGKREFLGTDKLAYDRVTLRLIVIELLVDYNMCGQVLQYPDIFR
ncbi:31609_t:CDS:2 [Gigaspora margarita]|uniref:31609_t:CDS:1 n=1 Tax=Gigaspora margarita TaxID=4874 RepID=A0ABN7V4S3_GIGMA|nr:31609_t:CDS:2 [Gigaspora margarita]